MHLQAWWLSSLQNESLRQHMNSAQIQKWALWGGSVGYRGRELGGVALLGLPTSLLTNLAVYVAGTRAAGPLQGSSHDSSDCFCVRGALISLGKTKQTVLSPFHLLGRSVQPLVLALAISLFISHTFQTNRDDKSMQFIATHNAGNFEGSEASCAICCWP